MSDNANVILMEQVSDELLNGSLSKFFALLDEWGWDEDYERLTNLFSDVVETIVEERSV